jgi:hypothetical protein
MAKPALRLDGVLALSVALHLAVGCPQDAGEGCVWVGAWTGG